MNVSQVLVMAKANFHDLKEENSKLRRTQKRLASDLNDEKLLVRNLMGTIKNYEKLLRLEGQSCAQEMDSSSNQHGRRNDSWGILCRSIGLVDDECLELTRTVAAMLEKVSKLEKIYENRSRKIANLNMRIERLDTIAFGQKVDC